MVTCDIPQGSCNSSNRDPKAASHTILAHVAEDGREQPLADHLRNTAERAGKFAAFFGAEKWGRAAGLLHDDGKASERFQRRIRGESVHVDHSTPSAKFALVRLSDPKESGKLLAYCIAGHHAGLPDGISGEDETCLEKRLARSVPSPGYLAAELPSKLEPSPIPKPPTDPRRRAFGAAFFTRMVYSCLVDADFLDTEAFLDPGKAAKREHTTLIENLKQYLERHLSHLAKTAEKSEINRLRSRIPNPDKPEPKR